MLRQYSQEVRPQEGDLLQHQAPDPAASGQAAGHRWRERNAAKFNGTLRKEPPDVRPSDTPHVGVGGVVYVKIIPQNTGAAT
jgi:hypothetical protein